MIVVPAGAVWIIVHELLHLPPDGLTVKIVDTAVGILLLHAVFTILQRPHHRLQRDRGAPAGTAPVL